MVMFCAFFKDEYREFIRKLRMNPELSKSFVKSNFISKSEQHEYMEKNGLDYWVCLDDDDKPMGFIGVVDDDLRIAVDPNHQHKGIGSFMLNFILNHNKYKNIKIKVRKGNSEGQKFFTKHNLSFTLVD